MANNISIEEAIVSLNSQASMEISGRDLDTCTITWTNGTAEISKTNIQIEMDRLQVEYDALDWKRNRKAEYPSVQDLVVALYDTDDKAAIEAKRAEIKLKYPKPGA
jgi:hypothetical protein